MNDELRYIAAIAEHGSISKAARAVHISQPGLSQRLKRLETQLGCELFNRETTPLTPTASGEVYIKYALRAIAAENSMRREVFSVAKNRRRLRVGVSMARANALLAEPIAEFYESHCGCTLELRELSTIEQLHTLFLSDGADFAVLTPIAPDPALYDVEFLCQERLVVVAAPDLKAPQLDRAVSGCLRISQLEGIPLVLPACGNYYDPLISRMVDISGAQLDVVVRDCSTDLALSLVEEGICVAIVPSTSLIGRLKLRVLALDAEAGNALRYIRRRDHPVSSEESLFIDILRKSLDN